MHVALRMPLLTVVLHAGGTTWRGRWKSRTGRGMPFWFCTHPLPWPSSLRGSFLFRSAGAKVFVDFTIQFQSTPHKNNRKVQLLTVVLHAGGTTWRGRWKSLTGRCMLKTSPVRSSERSSTEGEKLPDHQPRALPGRQIRVFPLFNVVWCLVSVFCVFRGGVSLVFLHVNACVFVCIAVCEWICLSAC